MKEIRPALIALVSALVLLLLIIFGDYPINQNAPLLEVDDGVTVIEPEARGVFSKAENGAVKDSARYWKYEALGEAKNETPVNVPFTLRWRKDYMEDSDSYTLYDMKGTELLRRSGQLTIPEEAGTYVCIVEAVFGTESVYSGCQFLFCFTVSDDE